ncbi:Mercuric resistance operon regulatory protein [bacterium HR33]|nr:Mercuric resistance operon regulatory protein [bacterium HR33]
MRIGELARLAGLRTHTIRFYERAGLLKPPRRTSSGYRDYDTEALKDLSFIARAQASGLKLRDVREIMAVSASGRPPCQQVRSRLLARLSEVERKLTELDELRRNLIATLERLEQPRMLPTGARCRCPAIESG